MPGRIGRVVIFIRVGFAAPHLVLVLTEANELRSMSGAVPMPVSR